jgi:hypothetical protein
MKSPEGIPLRVNTPQREQEKKVEGALQEVVLDKEAIRATEQKIIKYRKEIATSKEFIAEMEEKYAEAKSDIERKSIYEAIQKEEINIQNFTDGIETANAELAGFHDKKKDDEGHAFVERIVLRKKLH